METKNILKFPTMIIILGMFELVQTYFEFCGKLDVKNRKKFSILPGHEIF